jgi:anti-anti-sigma regulatory factor
VPETIYGSARYVMSADSDQQRIRAVIQTITHEDGRRTCRPAADLDWFMSMTLRQVVSDAMLEGDEVLIDLSEVSFVDATALGAIVDCPRQARSFGSVRVPTPL